MSNDNGLIQELKATIHELKLKSMLMIQTPDRWTYGDRLPLERVERKGGEFPQLGVIMRENPLTVIIDGNIFFDRPEDGRLSVTYPSARAIVEDGWLVA